MSITGTLITKYMWVKSDGVPHCKHQGVNTLHFTIIIAPLQESVSSAAGHGTALSNHLITNHMMKSCTT